VAFYGITGSSERTVIVWSDNIVLSELPVIPQKSFMPQLPISSLKSKKNSPNPCPFQKKSLPLQPNAEKHHNFINNK